jgi:phage terminase
MKLQPALRVKYEEFIEEGSLIIMPGTVLDMMDVYDDLDNFITSNNFDIRSVGFDPYNAKEFIERWAKENGQFGIEKVIQGARTESVPLGEIKKLAEDRKLDFSQKIITYTMGNCIVSVDSNNNKKLLKKRHDQKIDSISALLDAYVAYKINKEYYE